jgi:uncharacterized protein (DUF58 family)
VVERGRVAAGEVSGPGVLALEGEAQGLVARLPQLLIEAVRVSSTVTHGLHGRRRAGPGETFWQFRHYESGDAAQLIDWRRSASSDHLFVREREWEAAHTVWLWADLSASMQFRSHLSATSKRDRAVVLLLAAAELLVRAGERVALLGLTRPSASRRATRRMAETLAASLHLPALGESLPPRGRLSRFSSALLIGDFLEPPEAFLPRLDELAAMGVTGHLIQVLDPAEETLPYDGRTEFLGLEGGHRWLTDRAESLRGEYLRRFTAHRRQIADHARRLDWSFLVHHTDRPATEPLLALLQRLQTGGAAAGGPGWGRVGKAVGEATS